MPGRRPGVSGAGSMRKVRFATCLLALLCGGCAAQAVAPQPVASQPVEDFRVDRKPAGYYPAIAELISVTPQLSAWLAKNQPRIDEIQNRIIAIRDGRTVPGCIGQDKYTCVATLAQKFAITDSFYAPDTNVVADTKYDVNGKPLTGSKFEFYGYVPNPHLDKDAIAISSATKFALRLGRNGLVSALEARLPRDPTFARTQEEYDATDAYETVAAVTAKNCPALSRADVAKWIENSIKPNSKSYRAHVRRGVAALDISKKTTLCGRTFQFNSMWTSQTHNQSRRDLNGGMFLVVE